MNTVGVCVGCRILILFIETKLDYCGYALEEARPLLDRALDVKQKIRFAREFARVGKWLVEVMNGEIPEKEKQDPSRLCNDIYILLLHWYRRNRRRGHHHHRTWYVDFWKVTKWWGTSPSLVFGVNGQVSMYVGFHDKGLGAGGDKRYENFYNIVCYYKRAQREQRRQRRFVLFLF